MEYLSKYAEFEGLKDILNVFKDKADIEYLAIFDRIKIQEMLYKAEQ